MQGGEASAAQLEPLKQLLVEFYGGVGGARKAEIDGMLGSFKRQPGSWVHCQYFLSITPQLLSSPEGQYVLFFSVLVFEEFVKRYWDEAPAAQKDQIRGFLFQCLTTHHAALPPFLATKLAKVNVDVAKRDWPHDYPEFLSRLTGALEAQDDTAKSTALLLLQLVAEEFTSTRQDVLAARQHQIKVLLTEQMNPVLSALFGLLEPAAGTAPALCRMSLNTLSQFFTWVPLSQHVTPSRLSTLCACSISQASGAGAEIGLLALNSLNELLTKNYVPADFGDFLLVCFNHILALLDMIVADEASGNLDAEYIDRSIQFTLNFFTNHLQRVEGKAKEGGGFSMDRMLTALYQVTYGRSTANVTDLIRGAECWDFFVEYVIANDEHSPGELSLVARYQAGLLAVMEGTISRLLHVTNAKMLEELLEDERNGGSAGLGLGDDRLEEGGAEEEEDAEGEAGALQSESSQLVRCSLDLLANLAHLYPEAVLQTAFSRWQELAARWISGFAEAGIGAGGPVRGGGELGSRLAWVTRDACFVLQLWAALFEELVRDFEGRFEFSWGVIKSLLEFGEYCAMYGASIEGICGEAGVLCHAQLYATLGGIAPWLSAVLASGTPMSAMDAIREGAMSAAGAGAGGGVDHAARAALGASVLDKLLNIAVAALDPERPPVVSAAAARVLLVLSADVRPKNLAQTPQILTLLQQYSSSPEESLGARLAASQPHGLSPFLLACAVSNALLLARPRDKRSAQELDAAAVQHKAFTATLVGPFTEAVASPSFVECAEGHSTSIRYSLRCLVAMIKAVNGETNAVKMAMYDSIAGVLQGVLMCLQVYASTPHVVQPVIELLAVVATSLRCALSKHYPTFIDDTIGCFLRICEGDSIAALCRGANGRPSVLGNFLGLLSSLAADKGTLSASLLPDIIELCLSRLHPVLIVQADCPEEVQRAFFELVHSMLLHHWKYFVPSNLATARGSSVTACAQQHFLQLLQTVGACFESEAASPALYGYNLAALEALDSARQLYQRAEFATLRLSFLRTLFTTLLRRSHSLLQDEIVVAIHSIVSVDFEHFHGHFLFPFLTEATVLENEQKQALIDAFSTERDLPTFKTNVQNFVQDFCCFAYRGGEGGSGLS